MGTFLSPKSRTAKSSLPYKNLNCISFFLDGCDAKQKNVCFDWQQANNICFRIFIKVECVTYRKSSSTGVTKDLARVASLPQWLSLPMWLLLPMTAFAAPSRNTQKPEDNTLSGYKVFMIASFIYNVKIYFLHPLLKCADQLPMNWQTYCSYLTLHCVAS